ncbi:hypothetical protein HY418_03295 [Candidatus Kaiserbacteria bacterium]|nr:hypothetical protein [Candidatus Kaiserbacteria bacterium]
MVLVRLVNNERKDAAMPAQIAKCSDRRPDGLIMYYHSKTGESVAAEPDEPLPLDEDFPGRSGGQWEPLAAYNLEDKDTIRVFIELVNGAAGHLLQFDAGFIPERGDQVNLRGDVGDQGLVRGGLYQATFVHFEKRQGDELPHVHIVRLDDIDPTKFIYEVEFITRKRRAR